jgi:hypothetical protein
VQQNFTPRAHTAKFEHFPNELKPVIGRPSALLLCGLPDWTLAEVTKTVDGRIHSAD